MKINYEYLTEDLLEEMVEFIDWSLVPDEIISESIIKKFQSLFPEINAIVWFNNLLNSLTIKVDENEISFSEEDGDDLVIYNLKNDTITFSYNRIWKILMNDFELGIKNAKKITYNIINRRIKLYRRYNENIKIFTIFT